MRLRVVALNGAGTLAWHQGDYPLARSLHEESLAIGLEFGSQETIARSLEGFAGVSAGEGQLRRALRFAGAAAAVWAEGLAMSVEQAIAYDEELADLITWAT
jgi:hypothetical protein